MALNFPDSPTDGQKYTDAATGETWTYEASTNSWTSDGLTTAVGIQYKGGIDITAAPPAGVANGWQYTVTTGGTANAGFTGLGGNIPAGTTILYDGANWQEAGADVKWDRAGTALKPVNAGDTVQISAGTAALPGLTPVGDPNTGIYSPGPDQVAISTDGAGRLFVDSVGRLLAGTSSAFPVRIATTAIKPRQQLSGGNATDASLVLGCGSTTDSTASFHWFAKFASGTVGDNTTTVAPGELLGKITWSGSDGTNQTQAASIRGEVDGTPGSNSMPGRIVFGTTPSGSTSPAERLRLDGSGRLLLGTSTSINALAGLPAALQVHGVNAGAFGSLGRWEASPSGPGLLFNKSRGTAVGARSLVSPGDTLGSLYFAGDDGTEFRESAIVYAKAAGTPGANSVPADLVFATTAPAESAAVGRMRIKASGIVNITNTPIYADNAAAIAGGLEAGDVYRKADGTLMITY